MYTVQYLCTGQIQHLLQTLYSTDNGSEQSMRRFEGRKTKKRYILLVYSMHSCIIEALIEGPHKGMARCISWMLVKEGDQASQIVCPPSTYSCCCTILRPATESCRAIPPKLLNSIASPSHTTVKIPNSCHFCSTDSGTRRRNWGKVSEKQAHERAGFVLDRK